MNRFKNIIFDLGGVLLDIDYQLTVKTFERLGLKDYEKNYDLVNVNELLRDLECGRISVSDFYRKFNEQAGMHFTDEVIGRAWCATLLQFHESSLSYLDRLRMKARLFLLSNTNAIHYPLFEKIYDNGNRKHSFESYFIRCYYSFEIGKRKPDVSCFQWVLENAGIRAEETIFIDDTKENVEGAQIAGIKAILLEKGTFIEDLNLEKLIE